MVTANAFRMFLLSLWGLLMFVNRATSLTLVYCSSLNTGSSNTPNSSIYQSTGLCDQHCEGYAFGVLQGSECWCSNYAPGSTTSTSDCSTTCPGYPSDFCGNTDEGLYGYIALGNTPSGTVGASSAAASSTSESSSSPTSSAAPETEILTVSGPGAVSTVFITPTSAAASSSPSSSSSPSPTPSSATSTPESSSTSTALLTSSSSSWTQTPLTTVITVTGEEHTITTTPTQEPTASPAASVKAHLSSSGTNWTAGKVAGLSVGLVVLAAIITGIIFVCWRKARKMRKEQAEDPASEKSPPNSRSRSASENALMADKGLPKLHTSGLAPGFGGHSGSSPEGQGSPEGGYWPTNRRTSNGRLVDQRLEPTVLFHHDNSSRPSFQDDRDYSRRVLKVANPDHDLDA